MNAVTEFMMDLKLKYAVVRLLVNVVYPLTNGNDGPSEPSQVCVSMQILSSHCGGP
jgi:hypothetical protein